MERSVRVLGLELIVDDIDRATGLFTEVLGFELHGRGRSELFEGEQAVVTDGSVALTLLQPTTDGDGAVLPDRTPRLSQIVIGSASADPEAELADAVESGLSTTPTATGFYFTPESVAGALGIATAIVVVSDDLAGKA